MKILLYIIIAIITTTCYAQVTDLGGPKSWNSKIPSFAKIPIEVMGGFDINIIHAEDSINDISKEHPWRFGYKYDTDLTPSNSGEWIELNSGRLWRLGIEAQGAMTINLLFEDFRLPEGASLYLFDFNKTNRVGAYTLRNNRNDGLLGSELVYGDKIVVEYYEPDNAEFQGNFTISNVIHGYRSLDRIQQSLEKALNNSGDCNIDVHCPLGNGWGDQIRSVAMIVVGGSNICSGALINNTCEDGTPYFLTANHCLGGSTGNWAFRFNWASPPGTESCATTANSVDPGPPYDQTINGATILANGTQADFALLQIDNLTLTEAQNWNLFYAGWNNDDTDGLITQGTSIHHPSGDVMKICREDDSPYHNTISGAEVWYINQWEQGVTEGGSSGGPLFDQNKRIIGQLFGGAALCSGTNNNGQYDYFGRLGVSWDLGVKDYLAPVACGGDVTTNNGWDPNGPGLPDDASAEEVKSPLGLICSDSIKPKVVLRNLGSNNLTSCIINYNIDGGSNQTYNWSGVLLPNAIEIINLPSMSVSNGAHVFNAYSSDPNGITDTDPLNDASSSNFEAVIGTIETRVKISTDCFGYETYWEIRDASTTLIASGGNSTGIPPGGLQIAFPGNAGSYGSEINVTEVLCLAVGCYDFTIFDDWGDGIEGSTQAGCNTDGAYQIVNTSATVLASINNLSFGNSETNNFCVVDNAGINELSQFDLSVYPNPTNGSFTILVNNEGDNAYTVLVQDLTGRIVTQEMFFGNKSEINSNLSSGNYLVTILTPTSQITKSLVVSK